jgi:hypothetical protein
MRRIALPLVLSILVATPVARANDLIASGEAAQERLAADTPRDVITSTSPVRDDITSVSPVKDDITAVSPVKEEESVAPFVRLQTPRRPASLAGATLLRSLHVGLAVSQAYDVYSTTTAIRRGAVELNPLLKSTVGSRAAFIGLKVAMTAGPIWEAEKLWKKNHRVAAIALMAASNGIMMAVAKHNASVLKNAVIVK